MKRSSDPDFAVYEVYSFQSLSVESYEFNNDQYTVFAQPNTGICTVFIWDHVNMLFKTHYNITCKSNISCYSIFVLFDLMGIFSEAVFPNLVS